MAILRHLEPGLAAGVNISSSFLKKRLTERHPGSTVLSAFKIRLGRPHYTESHLETEALVDEL